jgi:hypothetical protein
MKTPVLSLPQSWKKSLPETPAQESKMTKNEKKPFFSRFQSVLNKFGKKILMVILIAKVTKLT